MPVFGRKPGLLGPLPGIPGSPGLLAEPCCASRNTGPLACLGPDPQSSTSQPIDLPRSKARTRYKVFIVKKSKVFRHNLRVGQVMVRTGTSPGPRPRRAARWALRTRSGPVHSMPSGAWGGDRLEIKEIRTQSQRSNIAHPTIKKEAPSTNNI